MRQLVEFPGARSELIFGKGTWITGKTKRCSIVSYYLAFSIVPYNSWGYVCVCVCVSVYFYHLFMERIWTEESECGCFRRSVSFNLMLCGFNLFYLGQQIVSPRFCTHVWFVNIFFNLGFLKCYFKIYFVFLKGLICSILIEIPIYKNCKYICIGSKHSIK